MTKLLLAILATLAGLAMVGGGVYGVVQDVSDDGDETRTTTSFSFPSVPTTDTPTTLGECDQAAGRDFRLGRLDVLNLRAVGKETGTAEVSPLCNVAVTLFVHLEGTRSKKPASYFVWLYKNRRTAKQIGSLIGSDGSATGSATIQPEVDTTRYDEIVITQVEFGVGEKRPRRIIFRGSL